MTARTPARAEVLNETFDLFIELGATDEQADFPVVYAVGMDGTRGLHAETMQDNLIPLFETIIKEIPAPDDRDRQPPRLLVTTLEYDNYKGQIAVGRLHSGVMKRGMPVVRITPQGEQSQRQDRVPVHLSQPRQAGSGRSSRQATFWRSAASRRLASATRLPTPPIRKPLPPISVEQPTVRMTFGVNTSPFAGREGKTGWGTSRRLRERLYNETRSNLALRVADGESPEKFVVSGRGELHLAILIETMRREGYEFEVSKPEVIYHRDPDTDEMLEPIEEVHIDVADVHDRHGGRTARRAARSDDRHAHRERHDLPRNIWCRRAACSVSARNFMTATSGMGQIHSLFLRLMSRFRAASPVGSSAA